MLLFLRFHLPVSNSQPLLTQLSCNSVAKQMIKLMCYRLYFREIPILRNSEPRLNILPVGFICLLSDLFVKASFPHCYNWLTGFTDFHSKFHCLEKSLKIIIEWFIPNPEPSHSILANLVGNKIIYNIHLIFQVFFRNYFIDQTIL